MDIRKLSLLLGIALSTSVIPSKAVALTIDELNGAMTVQPQQNQGPVFGLLSTADAVGGTRGLEGRVTSSSAPPGADMFVETSSGKFSHSQDTGIAGYSRLSWDGDTNPSAITFSGLGGLDLTQDSATAIAIEIISYDFPNGQPLPLEVMLYDATDPTKVSLGSVTLTSWVITLASFEIPFSAFVAAPGANGPADLSQIGAITLTVRSQEVPAADLEIEWVGTNGICRLVPDSQGRVIDDCGVCGGDNSSCSDCTGVPYGNAQVDRCGVCQGDGTSCVTCFQQDMSIMSATLDGGAKKLERFIREAAHELKLVRKDSKTQKFIYGTLKEVHRLQIANWVLSWVFPRTITTCDNEQVCSYTSYQSTAEEYRLHNEEMRQLGYSIIRKLRAGRKTSAKRAARYQKRIDDQADFNRDQSYIVPIKDFSC